MKAAVGGMAAAMTLWLVMASAADWRGDAERGRVVFERRCTGCHSLDGMKSAPPLRHVFGGPAARDAQYPYSAALKDARIAWDEKTLDRWLTDPEAVVPGNDMAFRLAGGEERADIIAYLKQLESK
jgi:cytochrome c